MAYNIESLIQRGGAQVSLNVVGGALTVTLKAVDPTVADAEAVAIDRELLRDVQATLSNNNYPTTGYCEITNGDNDGELVITAPSNMPLIEGENLIVLSGVYCGAMFVQSYSVTGVAEGSTTASAAITLNIIGSTPASSGGGETEPILYADLVAKRNAGELTPGAMYRITDYVTTVANIYDARSAGHAFDVVVTALDESNLAEEAHAVMHDGDTYFAKANMSAWKIWYSLDNDNTRFAWADAENGKGVIYRMIDEWGNDCPFDFKNVQFKRFKITECAGSPSLVGKYGVSGVDAYTVDSTVGYWCYAFSMIDLNDSLTHDVSLEQDVYPNNGGYYSKTHNNVIGTMFGSMRLGDDWTELLVLANNVFVTDTDICLMVYDGEKYTSGVFLGYNSNVFGNGCLLNSFGNACNSNTLGDTCDFNTFGDSCSRNALGDACSSNTLGEACNSNTFGDSCSYNTLGSNCIYNTLGGACSYNSMGGYCGSNTLGDDCSYLIIGDDTGNSVVLNGTQGESGSPRTLMFTASASYCQYAGFNSSGVLKIWTPADAVA